MASIYELLRGRAKGGPAGGRPYMEPGKPTYPTMNLTPDQGMAPHTLAAALAAKGPHAESSLKAHLSAEQERRRQLRAQQAVAAGLPADVAFYGPHADPRAQALLHGGSGFGRGLGAAQVAPQQPDPGLAQLVAQAQRRSRRRGAYRMP